MMSKGCLDTRTNVNCPSAVEQVAGYWKVKCGQSHAIAKVGRTVRAEIWFMLCNQNNQEYGGRPDYAVCL